MTLNKELRGTLDKSSSDIVTDALETEDETINNSITYPDGTTITTSPSSGGGGQFDTVFDPNSPFNGSGSSSYTLNLANSYDRIIIDGLIEEDAGGGVGIYGYRLRA